MRRALWNVQVSGYKGKMNYELISAEEYAGLPSEPEECFIEFEAICHRNMTRMIDESSNSNFQSFIQSRYMSMVASVAEECNIPVMEIAQRGDMSDRFEDFSMSVQGQVAKIRVRNRSRVQASSVQLAQNTKSKIKHHISIIRNTIDNSDLPFDRKEILISKLDELVLELENRRVSFGKVMIVLGKVLMYTAGVATIGAEGPTAVTNIMKLIAKDKDSEDAALQRLAPLPKALPAPPVVTASSQSRGSPPWEPSKGGDLDDEIPF